MTRQPKDRENLEDLWGLNMDINAVVTLENKLNIFGHIGIEAQATWDHILLISRDFANLKPTE